jgi:putative phosphoesterase
MKIGVISDTHDNLPKIASAVEFFNSSNVELVVHAGDLISPFTANVFSKLKPDFVAIYGNNDGERLGLKQRFSAIGRGIQEDPHYLEIGGRKIIIIHKPDFAEALAASGKYDIVIYGHTHKSDLRRASASNSKTLIVNPGDGGGWLAGKTTLAIIDLENIEAEVLEF